MEFYTTGKRTYRESMPIIRDLKKQGYKVKADYHWGSGTYWIYIERKPAK